MSRPKSGYDLSRLMKYLRRAPWDEMMDEMLVAHLGPACEEIGLNPDEIFETIGDHWEDHIWACAFEDLLTQFWEPHGLNLVDDYLKRRGWNEKAPYKTYLRALRDTVMSLYEVSEVVPGQSMTLRDLLRDVAPVTVHEQSATQTLVNWDKIAARIVNVNGRYRISGALLPFSPDGTAQVIEVFAQLADDAQNPAAADPSDRVALLRASAPVFTNLWLLNCLDKAVPSSMPDVVNADGDDILFHRIVFPLAKGVIGKSVARRLNAAEWLKPAGGNFWIWLTPTAQNKHPRTIKDKQALVTTTEDGTLVFANVELKERKLIVEVNSAARAEQAMSQISQWLGDCLKAPMTEIRTLAQVMADESERAPQKEALDIPPHEMERIVHDMLTREYVKTLDEPVPALGNKTPRGLARTKAGRAKVADWLKNIENGSAKFGANDPMGTYDFTWIWEELRLLDLRC